MGARVCATAAASAARARFFATPLTPPTPPTQKNSPFPSLALATHPMSSMRTPGTGAWSSPRMRTRKPWMPWLAFLWLSVCVGGGVRCVLRGWSCVGSVAAVFLWWACVCFQASAHCPRNGVELSLSASPRLSPQRQRETAVGRCVDSGRSLGKNDTPIRTAARPPPKRSTPPPAPPPPRRPPASPPPPRKTRSPGRRAGAQTRPPSARARRRS